MILPQGRPPSSQSAGRANRNRATNTVEMPSRTIRPRKNTPRAGLTVPNAASSSTAAEMNRMAVTADTTTAFRTARQHKRCERQKYGLEGECEDVPDPERIDGRPLVGFAAQCNQDCREASETDRNLRKGQQGICNVDDEHSRLLTVKLRGRATSIRRAQPPAHQRPLQGLSAVMTAGSQARPRSVKRVAESNS